MERSVENEGQEVALADVAFAQVLRRPGAQALTLPGQPRPHRGEGVRLLRPALSQDGDYLIAELAQSLAVHCQYFR